ncbi:MAG TPA: hypothetical protein VML55_04805, partial [Planctomycetaceae bacterium]|nr:hypothetical protein [Planctomycetaceae bacterium]
FVLAFGAVILEAKPPGQGGGANQPPPDPAIALSLNGSLAVMNADGSNLTVILAPEGRVNDSSWSPDADGDPTNGYQGSLVFERQFVQNNATRFDLWVIDVVVTDQGVAGANLMNLVAADSGNPAWSPRGDLIAFDGVAADQAGVFVVPATGGDPFLVIPDPPGGFVAWAAWNPDGTHLAFARRSDGIYSLVVKEVVDAETNELRDGPETVVIPRQAGFTRLYELDWSRSGGWIAFRGEGEGLSRSLYLVEARESGAFSVVPSTEGSTSQAGHGPAWSPDDPATPGDETDLFLVYSESSRTGPARTLLLRQDLITGEEVSLFNRKHEHATFPDWRRFPSVFVQP